MLSPRSSSTNDRYRIQSVARALTMLRAFSASETELGAAQISKQLRLDLTTTFRMLMTLQAQGFVEQNPADGKYRLGTSCLELGSRYIKGNDVRRSALSLMNSIRDQFGETVHLAILEGTQVIYLEKLNGLHPIGVMSSHVGGNAPAYCTGIGKVLLAYLSEEEVCSRFRGVKLEQFTSTTITKLSVLQCELRNIREKGYAIDNEEHEPDVMCCAVPIRGHSGVIAGVSIAGPDQRMRRQFKQGRLLKSLLAAGNSISRRMGASPSEIESPPLDLKRTLPRNKAQRRATK